MRTILALLMFALLPSLSFSEETFDVLASVIDKTKKEINAKQEIEKGKGDFMQSKFARLYKDGYWQIFQGKSDAPKGEYCTAMFTKEDNFVSIMGPGGSYRGALFMFASLAEKSIYPVNTSPKKIRVTLKQGNDPAVTTTALSQQLPNTDIPVVMFFVSTIEAAMEGMDDKMDLKLDYEKNVLAQFEWHSAVKAREELRKCLQGKPFYNLDPRKDKNVK